MLELTTKRPSMQVMVDGETCDVPLQFTAREIAAIAAAEDYTVFLFDFFGAYVKGFDQLGDADVKALLDEWTRMREELGEPSLGE